MMYRAIVSGRPTSFIVSADSLEQALALVLAAHPEWASRVYVVPAWADGSGSCSTAS